MSSLAPDSPVYSLGAVVKMTGLSEHTIRAWERRYGAVRPTRTPGGTRRFRRDDVARLRLLSAAVEAGHRISEIAPLEDPAIEELLEPLRTNAAPAPADILDAIHRLDAPEAERQLAMHLNVLGPAVFAKEVVSPVLHEVGDRWERGELSVAAEHLASAVIRAMLGTVLRAAPRPPAAPKILLATPEHESHEFGILIAAVSAIAVGAEVIYLGPNVPTDDLVDAARTASVTAIALGIVNQPNDDARRYLETLRSRLPEAVEIWVGGPAPVDPIGGVEPMDLDRMEKRIGRHIRTPRSEDGTALVQ